MDELRARRAERRRATPEYVAFLEAADFLGAEIRVIVASIDQIKAEVLGLVESATDKGSGMLGVDLRALHPVIKRTLQDHPALLAGAGFVADPEFLVDATQWLEWLMASDGQFTPLQAALDANDIAHYDYIRSDWFDLPKQGLDVAVVGPYVDLGGTNDYVVTITKPVRWALTFIGVVGADLSVDRVEGLLRRITRSVGHAALVVSAERRVIASSVPRIFPGALLRHLDLSGSEGVVSAPGLHVLPIREVPWHLVFLSCEHPPSCGRDCRACLGMGGGNRKPRK